MTTTLISSGDCTLQFGIWLWNRDSEFTKWQHPVMWYVALEWHTIEFAQTSAILEFYIWFPFPHITAVDMSFCTSLRNLIQIGPVGHPRQNKITSCRFSRWRISAILDCRDPIISSLKNQLSLHNFLWVVSRPRHHIALNCLVFEKIAFLHFGVKIQDGGSPPSWILGVPWWFLWKPITHQVTHQVRLHLASCPSSSWLIMYVVSSCSLIGLWDLLVHETVHLTTSSLLQKVLERIHWWRINFFLRQGHEIDLPIGRQ